MVAQLRWLGNRTLCKVYQECSLEEKSKKSELTQPMPNKDNYAERSQGYHQS